VDQLEVLVAELLAVDGLSTGALSRVSQLSCGSEVSAITYVAPGKVTALQHELGDDAVELGVLVAEALLAGAEGAEVLGRLGDDIVEEVEVDAAVLLCRDGTSAIAQRGELATPYSFATAAATATATAPGAEQSSAARHGGAAYP
jgi:hypothetical protein